MKTTSYNKIDASESDYLYTAVSQLTDAGNGLYTAISIYKDEMIAVFIGRILSSKQAKNLANLGNDRYFINLPNGKILDSMNAECFAKFANDAVVSPLSGFKNNAKIALDDEDRVGLIATRNIKVGEEIFCGYGKRYWRKHGII